MSDVNNRLEKQMEGTNLALAAVAEVLQKMDDRLSKAEEQEYYLDMAQREEYENANAVEERTDLVKAIAGEVIDVMKSAGESKQGMPTNGEGSRKAKASVGSGGTVTGGSNDDAKAVTIDSKTETVGQAIEAMQKQIDLIKAGYGMYKEEDEYDDDGSEEEPVDEEEDEEEEEEDDMPPFMENAMAQTIQNLQKQINDFSKGIDNKIVNESEKRLAKMGFKEETSLQSPSLIRYDDVYGNPLGIDGTTPVSKSEGVDVVDQLADMSYSQLRELQFKIEAGETDGIPSELLG